MADEKLKIKYKKNGDVEVSHGKENVSLPGEASDRDELDKKLREEVMTKVMKETLDGLEPQAEALPMEFKKGKLHEAFLTEGNLKRWLVESALFMNKRLDADQIKNIVIKPRKGHWVIEFMID